MEQNKNEMQIMPEKAKEAFENFFSMCGDCIKSDVCKVKGTPESSCCKHFYNKMNYKRYGNIYDMFKPIFEWINYHYPSGEVHFLVDRNSAQMLQEHGVYVSRDTTFPKVNPYVQSNGASVEIVKHGKTRKLFKCQNCDCDFYTAEYGKEVMKNILTLEIEPKKVWVARCPECNCVCTLEREED